MKNIKKANAKMIGLVAIAIATAMLASGCSYLFPVEEAPMDPPIVSPSAVSYTTATVKKGTIEKTLQGTAYVESEMKYKASFTKHGGYLTKLNNKLGAKVKKGDVLAELDTGLLRKELETAKIALEKTIIRRDALTKDKLAPTDLEIEKVRLSIKDQETAMKKLAEKHNQSHGSIPLAGDKEREMERAVLELSECNEALGKLLNPTDGIGPTDLEVRKAQLNIMDAEAKIKKLKEDSGQSPAIIAEENRLEMDRASLVLRELKEKLEELLNPTDVTQQAIKLAELDVKEQQSIVDRLSEDLSSSVLVAPISGQIMETVDEFIIGSNIDINQSVCTIADMSAPTLVTGDIPGLADTPSDLWPKALVEINGKNYSAVVSLNIQKDANGEAKSAQDATKKYKLTFSEVPNGKNFVADAKVSSKKSKDIIEWNYGEIITFGASFPFEIILDIKDDVLYLPLTAVKIVNDGNNKSATVTVLQNKVKEDVSVTIGMKTDTLIEIVSGVEEGAEVVIR